MDKMYIRKVVIDGIKCFGEKVEFDFTRKSKEDNGNQGISNWNVILAENGAGKTTLLQSIALALMNVDGIKALEELERYFFEQTNLPAIPPLDQENLRDLLTRDEPLLILTIKGQRERLKYFVDRISTVNRHLEIKTLGHFLGLKNWISNGKDLGKVIVEVSLEPTDKVNSKTIQYVIFKEANQGTYIQFKDPQMENYPPQLYAGYGAFRRVGEELKDSSDHYPGMNPNHPEESRGYYFGSLFDHRTPLLFYEKIGGIEDQDMNLFLSDLFPDKVESSGSSLRINQIPLHSTQISDGYRAMLALIATLATKVRDWATDQEKNTGKKHLIFSEGKCLIPGIVLIDEIDAHLHPSWQQKIGNVLVKKFPNIQFIVTTHSPFIPLVIDSTSNSTIHTLIKEENVVKASKVDKKVSLWQSDQILIDLFGLNSTFNFEIDERLRKYRIEFEKFLNGEIDSLDEELEKELENDLGQADFETERIDRIRELLEELAFLINLG